VHVTGDGTTPKVLAVESPAGDYRSIPIVARRLIGGWFMDRRVRSGCMAYGPPATGHGHYAPLSELARVGSWAISQGAKMPASPAPVAFGRGPDRRVMYMYVWYIVRARDDVSSASCQPKRPRAVVDPVPIRRRRTPYVSGNRPIGDRGEMSCADGTILPCMTTAAADRVIIVLYGPVFGRFASH
jgi:hypothetical protein